MSDAKTTPLPRVTPAELKELNDLRDALEEAKDNVVRVQLALKDALRQALKRQQLPVSSAVDWKTGEIKAP